MNSELEVPTEVVQGKSEAVCPACGGKDLERFFEIPALPVNCIALFKTREAALKCPTANIALGFCTKCGAVNNLAFDAARLTYDSAYDNSLHFSPTFQKYAEDVAKHLIDRFDLHGKNIIDVGCGNGEFLSLICAMGNNRGVGFDPSFIPGRAHLQAGLGVSIVPEYYSARHSNYAADFVVCRHVLEHIYTPQQFLRNIRVALTGNRQAAIFFELPSASFVFRNHGIWDVIYEHCFYYSAGSLARLFSTCGFDVIDVAETFNGQYLCLEARVSTEETGKLGSAGGHLESMRNEILHFSDQYRGIRRRWETALSRFAKEGKRVVFWGAGAKGAMFLNTFRNVHSLEYIVDVNPHKGGLHVPGTGQQVKGPEFLKEYRPDMVLIANPNYQDEIGRQVSALGLAPELLAI
jgi:SAM-dependent methyltransferase